MHSNSKTINFDTCIQCEWEWRKKDENKVLANIFLRLNHISHKILNAFPFVKVIGNFDFIAEHFLLFISFFIAFSKQNEKKCKWNWWSRKFEIVVPPLTCFSFYFCLKLKQISQFGCRAHKHEFMHMKSTSFKMRTNMKACLMSCRLERKRADIFRLLSCQLNALKIEQRVVVWFCSFFFSFGLCFIKNHKNLCVEWQFSVVLLT